MALGDIGPGRLTTAKDAGGFLVWFIAIDFRGDPHLVRWAEVREVTVLNFAGDEKFRANQYMSVIFHNGETLDLLVLFADFMTEIMRGVPPAPKQVY